MPERLQLFATAARGTEDLLSEELKELGAVKVRQDRGGVRFSANLHEALRVCLWTRIAMRVLSPVLEAKVHGADGLYDAVASVPWEEHLSARSTFAVEATLKDSEHSHSGFVALKVKDAIADRLRAKLGSRPDVNVRNPDVRVVAHLAREQLSLSLDLAGEPLSRRGYRVRPTAAPMKETLAAAMLRAVKYTGEEAVLDPMCGSGTLVIEAGLIAIRRPPAIARELGVEKWPHFGEQATAILSDLRNDARKNQRAAPFPIVGIDRDAEALEAARRNVTAAKLSNEIQIIEGDATAHPAAPLEGGPGLLVTNPPYGDRLKAGGQKGMKSFYFKLGDSLPQPGYRMAVLSGNEAFESAFHHRPTSRRTLWNGPIECTLLTYPAPGDSAPEPDTENESNASFED